MSAFTASGSSLTPGRCSGTSASTQVGTRLCCPGVLPQGLGAFLGRLGLSFDPHVAEPSCCLPRREAVPVPDLREGFHPGQLPHRPRAPAHGGEALRLRALRQEVSGPCQSPPCAKGTSPRAAPMVVLSQGPRPHARSTASLSPTGSCSRASWQTTSATMTTSDPTSAPSATRPSSTWATSPSTSSSTPVRAAAVPGLPRAFHPRRSPLTSHLTPRGEAVPV